MTTTPVLTSSATSVARMVATQHTRDDGNFLSGQMLNIKVQQRLDEQHYVVVLRGQTRKVISERPLPVGETVDTIVVKSDTDRLELRQVLSNAASDPDSQMQRADGTITDEADLGSLTRFYQCNFSSAELAELQAAVNGAPHAEQMTLAAMFLHKRGLSLDAGLLKALCAHQSTANALPKSIADLGLEGDVEVKPMPPLELAQMMRRALSQPDPYLAAIAPSTVHDNHDTTAATPPGLSMHIEAMAVNRDNPGSQGSSNDGQQRNFVFQLLNDIDADGMGVRYGTLPVLINGQLVELELVMYQHRNQANAPEPVKRLVMSVNTATLGTVQITAEASNNRLMIKITGDTSRQTSALAEYAEQVRELVTRFGWMLDSIGYEVRGTNGSLAQRVMEHSVRQEVVDHVW